MKKEKIRKAIARRAKMRKKYQVRYKAWRKYFCTSWYFKVNANRI
ncbi:DUF3983 domain-containing protein [Bacillus pacificus]